MGQLGLDAEVAKAHTVEGMALTRWAYEVLDELYRAGDIDSASLENAAECAYNWGVESVEDVCAGDEETDDDEDFV